MTRNYEPDAPDNSAEEEWQEELGRVAHEALVQFLVQTNGTPVDALTPWGELDEQQRAAAVWVAAAVAAFVRERDLEARAQLAAEAKAEAEFAAEDAKHARLQAGEPHSPDDCPACSGTGIIGYDSVPAPFGGGSVSMPVGCDCDCHDGEAVG